MVAEPASVIGERIRHMVGEPALVITVAHMKISFTNVINIAVLQINCCEFREKLLK